MRTLDEIITDIENLHSHLSWLLRSDKSGMYFAHICSPTYGVTGGLSFRCWSGDKIDALEDCLRQANEWSEDNGKN